MKKSYPLKAPGQNPPRVIEAIKGEVRKYLRRERRKNLPDGVDFWDFDCRIGADDASAVATHVADLNAHIDTASREQWPAVYIEILAKPGHRTRKNPKPEEPSNE